MNTSTTIKPQIEEGSKEVAQKLDFKNGTEMAALAASQINYHVMGYYPITPSTPIPMILDEMKAEGDHTIHMIPGDGEHGAAGICFGATTAGGRVINATSANGLLFSLEQLPVQSGSRYPMTLNVVCRAVSGPLNIRGDQSDIMFALNTGWIILFAHTPQEVYDFNIILPRICEDKEIRLPGIIAFDGFFTSHQKKRVKVFENEKVVQDFVGPFKPLHSSVDPRNPITIGPYMNDPDLINNKKQLALAMEKASKLLPKVFAEYGQLSGRTYSFVESYQMEDAESALFILGSSFDTARIAVDKLRAEGRKVGVVSIKSLRPYPQKDLASVFKHIKVVCVADRQDSFCGSGGNMSLELKAALKDDPTNQTQVFSRIYGLGGKEFFLEDAVALLNEAWDYAQKGKVETRYDYFGATPGDGSALDRITQIISREEASPGLTQVEPNPKTGYLKVKGGIPRELTAMPLRIAPGHGACPGCGIFPSLHQFFNGIEGDVVVLFHTGCAMVVTTGYPYSAHRVTYIHNLFQNGAATLSGVVEMFHERKRRGEIAKNEEITFIMVTGDGGNDIGMGPTIGAALRGHKMILLEYDNEGYMNTGHQLSFTTPIGHATATSHIGPAQKGKSSHHKDTAQIMAACHIPYVFTAVESNYRDLTRKAAKAQYYATHEGFVYGKVLSACPLSWRSDPALGAKIVQAAVDCNFFPLYEIEHGITKINYDPEKKKKKVSAAEWLKMMGKTKHLTKPEYQEVLQSFEHEVERRWQRLKAMAENSLL